MKPLRILKSQGNGILLSFSGEKCIVENIFSSEPRKQYWKQLRMPVKTRWEQEKKGHYTLKPGPVVWKESWVSVFRRTREGKMTWSSRLCTEGTGINPTYELWVLLKERVESGKIKVTEISHHRRAKMPCSKFRPVECSSKESLHSL